MGITGGCMSQTIKCPLCKSTHISFSQTADVPLKIVGNKLVPVADTWRFSWHDNIHMLCINCGASSDDKPELFYFVKNNF
jgi:hypothetical protein